MITEEVLAKLDPKTRSRVQLATKVEVEKQKTEIGDPSKIFANPGSVRYADLKAYLEQQRMKRLSS